MIIVQRDNWLSPSSYVMVLTHPRKKCIVILWRVNLEMALFAMVWIHSRSIKKNDSLTLIATGQGIFLFYLRDEFCPFDYHEV